MSKKSIKIQRVESILKELVPEALSGLDDSMLRGLCVTDVDCSKGKYDAKVFLDESIYTEDEKRYILSRLKKVSKHIQNHCLQSEGWFRAPNFKFEFDDRLQYQNRMDKLFEVIEKELKK